MDERRLRSFLTVVETGSVTRAARELHVAQPSLSQTIRSLESELGVELFDRVGRGIRPSPAGRAFVGPARAVLRAIDDARAALGEVVDLTTGRIEIAALATLTVDPVARLVAQFRRSYPGVAVSVVEPNTADEIISLVRTGVCELGVGHLTIAGPGLLLHSLGEQELLFVFPPSFETPPAGHLRVGSLAGIPLVVTPEQTSTRTLLEQAFAAAGVTPQIAVETAAREAIVPLVLAGAGAALLPAPLAREARRRGAFVRGVQPGITRPVGLIQRDGPLSAAGRAFLEVATEGGR